MTKKIYKVKAEVEVQAENERRAEQMIESLCDMSPEIKGVGKIKAERLRA